MLYCMQIEKQVQDQNHVYTIYFIQDEINDEKIKIVVYINMINNLW